MIKRLNIMMIVFLLSFVFMSCGADYMPSKGKILYPDSVYGEDKARYSGDKGDNQNYDKFN